MKTLDQLRVQIFADGADKAGMLEMAAKPCIRGLTTNPALMRSAGVSDYRTFALEVLREIPDHPISFEVFSDEFPEMERQAMEIASWGPNVYVKIPVTNTRRQSCCGLIEKLSSVGVKVNVTALMTLGQVREVMWVLNPEISSYVSVFAGRIADTGRDPMLLMTAAVEILKPKPKVQLIWASARELLNIFQAEDCGCPVITVSHAILRKLDGIGRDLDDYSLETVQMFYDEAKAAGFTL